MTPIDSIYVRLKAFTASFRVPTQISGTQLSLGTPSYSTIHGILSYATGMYLNPKYLQMGFRYKFKTKGLDLERNQRWKRDKDTYSYFEPAPRKREVHYNPILELFIIPNSNLEIDFYSSFKAPKYQLFLGRSQDIAYVDKVEKIKFNKCDSGLLRGTTVPYDPTRMLNINGVIYNLPEWFDISIPGKVRRPNIIKPFISLDFNLQEFNISNLFSFGIIENTSINLEENEVIYIHQYN